MRYFSHRITQFDLKFFGINLTVLASGRTLGGTPSSEALKTPRRRYFSHGIAQVAIIGLLTTATVGGRAQDAPTAPKQTVPYYANALEKVWKTVRDHFWDKNFSGLDWRKIGEQYRAKLPDVKTKAEFETLVNAMLRELHASHTDYMTDDDIGFYLFPSVLSGDLDKHRAAHIGIMGQAEAGGWRVSAVLDGGAAEKVGLRSGDLIVSADGQPFTSAGSCRGKEGREITLTVKREGETAPLTFKPVPIMENLLRAFLKATERSARVLEVGGKRIGYIHLWTMSNSAFKDALDKAVLEKLADTDGLILDLRDGYGGTPFGYLNVFDTPDITWEQTNRDGALTRHTGYDRPMTVLINGGTRSAKEYFTLQFKKSKRATVIGTTTTGAFLGANGFSIAPDGYLELPVVGLKLDGKRIEGVGVPPDIAVAAGHPYTAQDAQRLRAEAVLLDALRALPPRPKSGRDVVIH